MSRLFIGTMPTGLAYCDLYREINHDYARVAFLPFSTLELAVEDPDSPLLPEIVDHAATVQAQRGQPYRVSTCGQTVILGGGA